MKAGVGDNDDSEVDNSEVGFTIVGPNIFGGDTNMPRVEYASNMLAGVKPQILHNQRCLQEIEFYTKELENMFTIERVFSQERPHNSLTLSLN